MFARTAAPEVFSAEELARATGLPVRRIRALIRTARIPTMDGRLVARRDAVRACRALRAGRLPGASGSTRGRLFQPATGSTRSGRSTGLSLVMAGSVHATALVVVLVLASVAVPEAVPETSRLLSPAPVHLVFVAEPGPGGGGGGGGTREPAPPPAAERKGTSRLDSPLPRRRAPTLVVPRPRPVARQLEPIAREPLPPVLAPLAALGTDQRDTPGLLAQVMAPSPPPPLSRGSGTGDGVGDGAGVGIGSGTGRGVGPGTGGGTGGGPYRAGSGIDPPALLREVTPDYTEQARRAGLEGEVLLEVVVAADGAVSDVRVLRRLGAGLDEQAVTAVRQWRFSPARRGEETVAVIVEVAVAFTLR